MDYVPNICKFDSHFQTMKQSWNSRLTPAQTKVVSAIYGQARVEEGLYSSMRDLILMSKAPGTIHLYTTSISRWNSYASSNGYRVTMVNSLIKFPNEIFHRFFHQ